MNYPSLVSLREVAPRDGWQKFKTVLPTEVKRELICSMIDYGARELEIGVFSSDPVRGRQYLDLEPLCQAVLLLPCAGLWKARGSRCGCWATARSWWTRR